MATFLELCERLSEESGGTGQAPVTVVGQTGRQKKIVNWVRDAWTRIQNLHPYWSFLYGEFDGTLTPGTGTYSSASFGLTRFASFAGERSLSIYDAAIGRADESHLRQVPFDTWRRRWDFGDPDANRPTEFAIGPDATLRLGAEPDDAYAVRGQYIKSPQILAANSDVPDMPARFHDVIVWRAIMLMSEHDEAMLAYQTGTNEYRELLTAMERDLLPIVSARSGRPLA